MIAQWLWNPTRTAASGATLGGMFGSCLTSRLVLGAVGGYSLLSLSGNSTWAWIGAALGALAVYLWSRRTRSGTGCATGCGVRGARRTRSVIDARSTDAGSARAPHPGGPR